MSSQVASLWHNRDFLLLLWSGRGISVLGVGISNISWPLLIWVITHSSAQAGFVSAMPNLVLGFPAGAFIDRWNRKLILICCDTARFLAFGSVPLAVALGSLSMALLYSDSIDSLGIEFPLPSSTFSSVLLINIMLQIPQLLPVIFQEAECLSSLVWLELPNLDDIELTILIQAHNVTIYLPTAGGRLCLLQSATY